VIALRKLRDDDKTYGAAIAQLRARDAEYRTALKKRRNVDKYLDYYKDAGVKAALFFETHQKCAYCESKYDHIAWGDVEHVLPKSNDPKRLLDYDNLTVACPVCNGRKRDREYHDGSGLLDPFNDDPKNFLYVDGTFLWPSEEYAPYVRAKRTIDDIQLNRDPLIGQRKELLEHCHMALREYRNAPTAAIREFARETILDMTRPGSEFSAVATAFFRLRAPELFQSKRRGRRSG
jgi:uncharacterized protein (TIGR02646 family)